jgi:hypothetical protein
MASSTDHDAPDYDVRIEADELLADLVEMAQDAAETRDFHREVWREELERGYDIDHAWERNVRAQTGFLTALGRAIAALQPENHDMWVSCFRNSDGTVDVRGYLRWLSAEADRSNEVVNECGDAPRANKMESGFCRVMSLVRDDYGVGWPRLDDLGGNPLECDLP